MVTPKNDLFLWAGAMDCCYLATIINSSFINQSNIKNSIPIKTNPNRHGAFRFKGNISTQHESDLDDINYFVVVVAEAFVV
jgi:hypothetical protein